MPRALNKARGRNIGGVLRLVLKAGRELKSRTQARGDQRVNFVWITTIYWISFLFYILVFNSFRNLLMEEILFANSIFKCIGIACLLNLTVWTTQIYTGEMLVRVKLLIDWPQTGAFCLPQRKIPELWTLSRRAPRLVSSSFAVRWVRAWWKHRQLIELTTKKYQFPDTEQKNQLSQAHGAARISVLNILSDFTLEGEIIINYSTFDLNWQHAYLLKRK